VALSYGRMSPMKPTTRGTVWGKELQQVLTALAAMLRFGANLVNRLPNS
jgi:hypothetical protein